MSDLKVRPPSSHANSLAGFRCGRFLWCSLFLLQEGQESAIAEFQERIQKKDTRKCQQNQAHEEPVHRSETPCNNDPRNSRERNAAEQDGNQQCHGKQETLPLVPFCHHGLKDRSRVLLSFAPSVTFWSCSPSFSCTKARVYSPGGRPLISNLPSGPVTA